MNSLRTTLFAGFGLALATLTPAAAATSAIVADTISERAGPSTYYPVIVTVPSGAPIVLYGCLTGGSWCDVSYAGARGWLPGSYVETYYQSQPVFVPYYIGEIGIPIVSFDIDVYWGDYYRDRPFYGERVRYEHYAHGPGAHVALAGVPGPRGPHGRMTGGRNGQFIAGQGPRGNNRRLDNGPGHPQTLAAGGPKNHHKIGTNAAHPMFARGPVNGPHSQFAMGNHGGPHPQFAMGNRGGPHPQFAMGNRGGPHPQFAMGGHGGGKCHGKGICG
jgi:uncharacterized protein YraI